MILPLLALAMFAPQAAPPPPPAVIAAIAGKAAAAQESGQLDEAAALYRQAVLKAPSWQEGWWQIGAIEYSRDHYPQCRDAFRRFVTLNAKVSAAFAFAGLCEFQTRDFPTSVKHLETAVALGLPNGEQLTDVAMYHLALLHTRGGNFERALQFCTLLARRKVEDKVIAVAGTAALRRAVFPHELPQSDQELAYQIGSALLDNGQQPGEIVKRFEAIAAQYPTTPNVHYTFSTLLLANQPDRAIQELQKELEISPDHLPSLVSLALEYVKRGDARAGRPYAEHAARIAPSNFVARACLGRVLLEIDTEPAASAIRELEAAEKLAPDSPQVRVSLASAYSKAGRTADAQRERAEFARLKKLAASSESPEAK